MRRFFIVLFILLLMAGGLIYADRNWLVVRQITTVGNAQITSDTIEHFSGVRTGQSLLQLRRNQVRENILVNPYIEDAQIQISWNGQVTLKVTERTICGMAEIGGMSVYFDNACVVLETRSQDENLFLPQVIGMQVAEPVVGEQLALPAFTDLPTPAQRQEAWEYARLLQAVASRSLSALQAQNALDTIRTIDVTNPDEVRYISRYGIEVLLGPALDLPEKTAVMLAVLPEIRNDGHLSGTLDVADPAHPVFTPIGSQNDPSSN